MMSVRDGGLRKANQRSSHQIKVFRVASVITQPLSHTLQGLGALILISRDSLTVFQPPLIDSLLEIRDSADLGVDDRRVGPGA